jgi:hypothetical protein
MTKAANTPPMAQDSVIKDSFTTAADGKNYATRFYNLDYERLKNPDQSFDYFEEFSLTQMNGACHWPLRDDIFKFLTNSPN